MNALSLITRGFIDASKIITKSIYRVKVYIKPKKCKIRIRIKKNI